MLTIVMTLRALNHHLVVGLFCLLAVRLRKEILPLLPGLLRCWETLGGDGAEEGGGRGHGSLVLGKRRHNGDDLVMR
jgi:hypothetical protein